MAMEEMIVKDSNGTVLNEGDSVLLIKSLKVKGSVVTLKKGTLIKKIRLTSDAEEVDCKVENMSVVLKTCFLKKK
jgi:protein PhnA